jgi:hypothetical protein
MNEQIITNDTYMPGQHGKQHAQLKLLQEERKYHHRDDANDAVSEATCGAPMSLKVNTRSSDTISISSRPDDVYRPC